MSQVDRIILVGKLDCHLDDIKLFATERSAFDYIDTHVKEEDNVAILTYDLNKKTNEYEMVTFHEVNSVTNSESGDEDT